MHLLDLIAQQKSGDQWRQIALADGFPNPPKPKEKRRPLQIMIPSAPESFLSIASGADASLKPRFDKILSIVHWPGQPGYAPPLPPPPLSAAEQARFDAGKIVFAQTCSQCHKLDGKGQEGKAPPLLDSEWALGPATRMARIALHGLHGPITVSGKTYVLEMPSFAALTDDQIASVLTYIRREWDHEASPVDPALVQKIRAETKSRTMPWTEPELLQVK
jgi:mono/diheme cytochrome c family protein